MIIGIALFILFETTAATARSLGGQQPPGIAIRGLAAPVRGVGTAGTGGERGVTRSVTRETGVTRSVSVEEGGPLRVGTSLPVATPIATGIQATPASKEYTGSTSSYTGSSNSYQRRYTVNTNANTGSMKSYPGGGTYMVGDAASYDPRYVGHGLYVPMSGDLVDKVQLQLAGDHRELGNASATLLSVQTEVDQTEQSMLGKVLDLQTARNFFNRHEEIDIANKKLAVEISQLNAQVEGLSSSLSKVQKEFLANAVAYRSAEEKLHIQIIQDESVIKSIQAELAKEDDIKAALHRLTQIHQELMKESVDSYKSGLVAVGLLKNERSLTRLEVGRHRLLRNQLVRMHNYSVACHASVEKVSKKFSTMLIAESKDNQAGAMTLQQKKKAKEATEQRLLAERALLVSEVKRAEKDEVEGIAQIKVMRGDFQVLERSIATEIMEMEAKIEAEKKQVKTLSEALMENAQAESEDLTKKEAMDKKLADLMKQVHDEQNPIVIATLEGQNDALQTELNAAYAMWKKAQEIETASNLQVDTVNATLTAVQKGYALAQESVQTAVSEGEHRLAIAVAEVAKKKADAKTLYDKAKAAVAQRCKTTWDSIWKEKRAKLVKCKSHKEELAMERAKESTLKQTLKATTESNNA